MNVLKNIGKFLLLLILCVLLTLTQMFIMVFIFSLIHELIVNDTNYMLLVNNSMYKYIVIFVVITTFLILVSLYKKGWIKLNEDIIYLEKFVYNKYFITIFGIISVIFFALIACNFDAIYKDRIVSYSILNVKGVKYDYEDIDKVDVKIKKYFNGSMSANYILTIDNHQIEVLSSIANIKNEKDSYDHNIYIDEKIKELKIKKNIDSKYLDDYNKTLDKKYADKISVLFEKN